MPNNKQDLLDAIRTDILKNDVCSELRATATNLVMGDGNPDADIVFIGEAPGKNEDLQGKPFVGASGKFLNEMLESVGLQRDDIYITNIVKYRPPNNRDPLPAEKQAFMPYLLRQLDVINPKLVVTLGRHSMEYFLPKQKISVIHGQPQRILLSWPVSPSKTDSAQTQTASELRRKGDGLLGEDKTTPTTEAQDKALVILPLYHPAAALYNGSQRSVLMDDFSKVPQILQQLHTDT